MSSLLKVWVIRYVDAEGRQVKKSTPGARKVKERSAKWYGQYLDAEGKRRRVPLCTDKMAARQELARLEKEAQLNRAGVFDPYATHRNAPIAEHVVGFQAHIKNKGVTPRYLRDAIRDLNTLIEQAGAKTLAELTPEAVERFLSLLAEKGTGSRTRNKHLGTAKSFTRWCLLTRRTEMTSWPASAPPPEVPGRNGEP